MHQRQDIQGLRGIAVLSVFLFHLGFPIGGGFIGVDVFFVISGYLISGMIFSQIRDGRFSIAEFYFRRIKRIMPAALLISAIVLGLSFFAVLPEEFVGVAKSSLASALFAPNLYFWATTDYFSPSASQMPLLHYWSLGVEEQFYFFFPAFALLCFRLRDQTRMIVIGLLLLSSLALSQFWIATSPSSAFYLLPSRAFELLIGTLIAAAPSLTKRNSFTAAIGAALVAGSLLFMSESLPFPGIWALPACVGTALIIWAGEHSPVGRVIAWRPLAAVGAISFSLYLVHWPAIVFFDRWFPGSNEIVRYACVVGASLALASLVYAAVEQPFRKMKAPLLPVFSGAAVAVCVVSLASFIVISAGGYPGRLAKLEQDIALFGTYEHRPAFATDPCFAPDLDTSVVDIVACTPVRPKTVVLWGDSLAAQYYHGIKTMLEPYGFAVQMLTASACPSILDFSYALRPNCADFNEQVFERLTTTRPDLIIVGGSWGYGGPEKIDATLSKLSSIGQRVVVLGQPLTFFDAIPDVLIRRIQHGDPSPFAGDDLDLVKVMRHDAELSALVARYPSLLFAPVWGSMCVNGCPIKGADGMPLYADTIHLTNGGSDMAVEKILSSVLTKEILGL